MRALRSRRSPIACVLLLLYLPACHSWHTGTPTPAQFVETERPQSVRVTRTDGTTLTVKSPVVRGDSLVGRVGDSQDTTRTVLALSDISRVQVKQPSTGKTVALVIVVAGVIVGLSVAAVAAGNDAIATGIGNGF